jgi:hypothetical protein
VPFLNETPPDFSRSNGLAVIMKHAATRDLYCYWDRLRGARTAPERIDIDPGAIRRILGDTFIIEVDAAETFPFRLAGTRLCAMMGHELRGCSALDAWSTADGLELRRLLSAVSDELAAVVIGVEAKANQGQVLDLEMLLLPLRHRGKTHSRILGSLTPSQVPYWIGVCPLVQLSVRSIRILWPSSREALSIAPLVETPLPPGVRRVGHLTVVEGGRSVAPTVG